MEKMIDDIENGNEPLDRVEQFCRERKICSYWFFIRRARIEAPELAKWARKSGRGVAARIRGNNARIAKVRQEIKNEGQKA